MHKHNLVEVMFGTGTFDGNGFENPAETVRRGSSLVKAMKKAHRGMLSVAFVRNCERAES